MDRLEEERQERVETVKKEIEHLQLVCIRDSFVDMILQPSYVVLILSSYPISK